MGCRVQEGVYAALQQRMRLPDGFLRGASGADASGAPEASMPQFPIVALYESAAHKSVGPSLKKQLTDFLGEGQARAVSLRPAFKRPQLDAHANEA